MSEPDVLQAPQAQPTGVRFLVLGTAFLVAVLLYLHRFTMSYAEQYVREDLGLNESHLSWCFWAFFFAYALAQVPSGWLSDRFGSRLMLTIYILVWSGFTASMGLVTGFVGLLLVRAAVGLGQAGAYPTCAAVVGRWAPFNVRALVSSVIAMGGRVGGAVAPVLTSLLIVAFVPSLTPEKSQLGPQDLLNIGQLAEQLELSLVPLEKPAEEVRAQQALAAKIRAGLPAEVQQQLAGLQRAYVAAQDKPPAKPRKFGDKPLPKAILAPADAPGIIAALNQVLTGPMLATEAEAKAFPVEREAKRIWKLQSISDSERVRVNRLLLEVAIPTGIRKVYVGGWRRVMFFFGSLGIAAAVAWMVFVRNRPLEHPWSNAAENQLITGGLPPLATANAKATFPWVAMLKSPSLWNLSISQLGTNIGWAFLVTWLPRYLREVHRVPFEERSVMASIPLWIGCVGMLTGGWATDRLTKAMGLRIGRSWPVGLSRFVGAAAFAGMLIHPDAWTATILFAVVAFSTDFSSPPMWAYSQDVGGRYTAAILGWSNMWGNLGAAFSPLLLNYLLGENKDNWDAAFGACAVAFVVAGVTGMFIDATKKIDLAGEA